jgi:acyl-CoA synthetase (AMP-forming)/AMP-acid ligase II
MSRVTELAARAWDGRASDDPAPFRQLRTDRFLAVQAARQPNKEALRCGHVRMSYGELDALATRVANGLAALGLRPGDVVGVVAGNTPEVFGFLYGVARAGVSVLPLNPRFTPTEMAYQVADAGARLVVSTDPSGPDQVSLAAVMAAGSDAPVTVEWGESTFFHVRYTSGTTGQPKCIATTQRAIATMHANFARDLLYSEQDVALVTAPMAHAAFHIAAATVVAGGTVVLAPAFDPATIWHQIDAEGITHTFLAPTMIALALESPGDVPGLRQVFVTASAFPLALKHRFAARFPHVQVYDSYGATEIGIVTLLRPWDPPSKLGTSGRAALGYELRIYADDGQVLGPGEIGHIHARGPGMSFGYIGEVPMKDGQVRDGFVSVGDLGSLDDDGYLTVADRRDDLIVSGGLNVYPAEVENVLLGVAGVREVAVVGVPDDVWGHLVIGVVAVVPGSVTVETLERACRDRLAGYKVPRRIEFVDSLPRNLAGKILRRVVREGLTTQAEALP